MRSLIGLTLALAVLGCPSPARAQAVNAPGLSALTASEILERMANAYATCKSYRDAGVVKSVITSASGAHTESLPFRTAFVRPGKFRFEYTASSFGRVRRYIIWEDGEAIRKWWDIEPGVQVLGSLNLAIAGATGVSGGSAHTVPRMLMPLQVTGTVLFQLAKAERLPDEQLDDVSCFVVKGKFASRDESVWIDQRTNFVRKIHCDDDIKNDQVDMHVETTTTYEPEGDVEIGAGELAFDPPNAAQDGPKQPEPVEDQPDLLQGEPVESAPKGG